MDPVGRQSKISSKEHGVHIQKLIDGGGQKSSYGVGPKNSGTYRTTFSTTWEGTTKGKIKHTYGAE